MVLNSLCDIHHQRTELSLNFAQTSYDSVVALSFGGEGSRLTIVRQYYQKAGSSTNGDYKQDPACSKLLKLQLHQMSMFWWGGTERLRESSLIRGERKREHGIWGCQRTALMGGWNRESDRQFEGPKFNRVNLGLWIAQSKGLYSFGLLIFNLSHYLTLRWIATPSPIFL